MTERLWIFSHYALPPGGGGMSRPFDFATRIADMGVDVTIFASSFNHWSGREEHLGGGRLYSIERYGNVRYVWLRTPRYRGNGARRVMNMSAYVVMSLLVQRRLPAPTAVLGVSAHLLAPLAAYMAARSRGARFSFEVGDIWPQTLVDVGALRAGSMPERLLSALEFFLYRRADRIVALLPRMGDYLEEHGISRDKVVDVPNGVDARATGVAPVSEAGLAALAAIRAHHERREMVALYAGAHGLVNRLDVVVRAARAAQDRHPETGLAFVLMGDGPEKPRLQASARALGLGNVTFLDPVPKDESTAVIATADVGLVAMADLAVYRYGLSLNKIFDYWNAGIPIVLSANVPDDPVSAAGGGVVVPADDADAVAVALARLAAMTGAERNEMGARGRSVVLRDHDLDVLARRLAVALGLVAAPAAP